MEGKKQRFSSPRPPLPLLSLPKDVVVAVILSIGLHPAIFMTQLFPQKERLHQGRASLPSLEVYKQTPGDGVAGVLERRMGRLRRGKTQPGGPSSAQHLSLSGTPPLQA